MKRKNKKLLPLLAFATAFIIWGVSTVFIKIGVDAMPVSIFMAIRYILAALLLLPYTLKRYKKMNRKTWVRIIISSLIGMTLTMMLLGIGLRLTEALDAALIFLLAPVIMYLLSIEMLREKFNAKILVGLIIALSGAVLVIISPALESGSIAFGGSFKGNLIVVLAVIVSVIGTIIIKPVLKTVQPHQVTTIRFVIAAISIIPFAVLNRTEFSTIQWTKDVLFALFFVTILGSVVAYGMYHWGLKKLSGEQSSVLHYLDPLGGVMASILILGDKVTPLILLGGGLTILGVYSSGSKVKLRLHHFHSHK